MVTAEPITIATQWTQLIDWAGSHALTLEPEVGVSFAST